MDKLTKGEDTLAFLAYSIVNDTLPEDRFFCNQGVNINPGQDLTG